MNKKVNVWMIIAFVLIAVIVCESVVFAFLLGKQDEPTAEVTLTPGTIRGKVMNDLGEMVMANVIVEEESGATKLYTTNVLSGYEIKLAEGVYKLHYTRGMQFSTVTKTVVVENFKNYYLEDIRLVRLFDAEQFGYFAGDLHQHTLFSDGTNSVEELIRADIAAGLSWALLTDHNDNTGISEWLQSDRLPYDIVAGNKKFFTPIAGVEITTGYGHFQSIGNSAVVEQWDIDLDLGENPYDEVATILKEIRRNGAIVQLNHPYSTGGMGFNNYTGLWDLITGFDTIEIWNGYFEPCGYVAPEGVLNQNRQSMLKWFELLNNGHKIFATSGTDIHSIAGSFNPDLYKGESKAYEKLLKQTGQYAGMPTIYTYIEGEKTTESILKAVQQGNSFISNGVLIFADVGGKIYGQTASSAGDTTLNAKVFCRDGLTKLNVIKNGEYIEQFDVSGTDYEGQIQLKGIEAGDWIVIEAYGEGVFYAVTNPIFFD